MQRTRFRPLATGRIKLSNVIIFAITLAVSGLLVLIIFVNFLTALLSLSAILVYSLVYTPLKLKTPLALVIGAFPGAVPPLLGWTAVCNKIDLQGLALFGILFAWQMPHFIAIAIYHKNDYANAGIKVVSAIRGEHIAKIQAFLWAMVLFIVSISLVTLKLGGWIYLSFALVLGIGFYA